MSSFEPNSGDTSVGANSSSSTPQLTSEMSNLLKQRLAAMMNSSVATTSSSSSMNDNPSQLATSMSTDRSTYDPVATSSEPTPAYPVAPSDRQWKRSRSRSPADRDEFGRIRRNDYGSARSSSHRSRSPGRSRPKDFDRDGGSRDYDRGRSRDYDRDRYRGRDDRRDRDSRRDYGDDRRDRGSRDRRSRDRDERRDRDRDERRRPEKRTRSEEQFADLTRDVRTIFVSQLVVRATERDIRKYFEQVGNVEKVSLIRDRNGTSKGIAYVEFSDLETVPQALLLNGQKFCMKHTACVCSGFQIAVKQSEAEKNYAAQAELFGGSILTAGIEKRLYVSNLPSSAVEGDIRKLGDVIGDVSKVFLVRDSRGISRQYGYIAFNSVTSANKAARLLDKFSLGGRELRAGLMDAQGSVVAVNGDKITLGAAGEKENSRVSVQAQAALLASLSSQTAQKTQSMVSSGGIAESSIGAVPLGETPTLYVLVENCFEPALEHNVGWERDVAKAFKSECLRLINSDDQGLFTVTVDPLSSKGRLLLTFSKITASVQVALAIAGKVFSGKHISVSYISETSAQTFLPFA